MTSATGKVILVSATDAAPIVAQIRNLLRDEPIEIHEGPDHSVKLWDAVVVLFVITTGAIADPLFAEYAQKVAGLDLPIVPVVSDLSSFNFESLPKFLESLRERNALSVKPGEGPSLAETVEGYLGLASFAQDRKVFISYRRSDGKRHAEEIYDYLWLQRYQVFMDTFQIEGGVVVQDRIKQEISDKDLLLLIDSPAAASSKWVIAEVVEAATHRIPICAVLTTPALNLQLVRDIKHVSWVDGDPKNLERVQLLVSRGIASRDSLDRRVIRTIHNIIKLKGLELREMERRRVTISDKTNQFLLEYEDYPVSLERLHRLYLGLKELNHCKGALFVGGNHPVLQLTRDAVHWARGKNSLEVLPVSDLYWALDQLFS
jgi:TIR domain